MFKVYRGNVLLGKILGYASDVTKTKLAAKARYGAGVRVTR